MPTSFWDWMYFGVLILCWSAFLIVWCAGAIYNIFKAPATQRRSGWLPSWVPDVMLICAALLLSPLYITKLFPPPPSAWEFLIFGNFWLHLLGALLLLTATAFTLWARFVLGLMWTSLPVIKSGHILHTDGPYRITRHPIYTGLLGMVIGSCLLSSSGEWFASMVDILIIVAVLTFLEIKIVQEERLLLSTFGEQYVQFKKRVPQLIPFTKWIWRIMN